jgi:hypothetical protein
MGEGASAHETGTRSGFGKKIERNRKKGLRSFALVSREHFTGGAEVDAGTFYGARAWVWLVWKADNSGVYEGGRAGKLGRTCLVVCLWVAL